MNVALEFRPIDVRLIVAYMADAVSKFPDCAPDNTFVRMYQWCDTGSHPYNTMWSTIHKYFETNRWYEMSDHEIRELWKTVCTVGIDNGDTHIPGIDVLRIKQRWDENGWNRYERKRNGRRSVAYKFVPMGILGCLGITMPVDVSV